MARRMTTASKRTKTSGSGAMRGRKAAAPAKKTAKLAAARTAETKRGPGKRSSEAAAPTKRGRPRTKAT